MSDSSITLLAALITSSVANLQQACNTYGVHLSSPTEPFRSQDLDPFAYSAITGTSSIIVSAAAQLIAIVRPPTNTIVNTALQFHVSSSLRAAVVTNVPEILQEAGDNGLHINEISRINRTNPAKLGRILRLLATEYIFREVAPDVFTNNRTSYILGTGKSIAELYAHPDEKHRNTSGVAAVVAHFTDEPFKSSAYLTESLLDSKFSHADEPNRTAFNLAFNTERSIFPWYELPENKSRLATFSYAMEGGKNMFGADSIVRDFPWVNLPQRSTVVDVGGGIGTQSLALSRAFPQLDFVVQDLPGPIRHGAEFWNSNFPEALASKRVVLKEHDFFEAQPEKNAAVYLLRMILHDWADVSCIKILRAIRASAGPSSKLLLVEDLRPYACVDTTAATEIPGGVAPVPPLPLLPNWGHASLFGYLADLEMMVLMNGQERTLFHLSTLLSSTGWKIERIYRDTEFSATHHQILAVPEISKLKWEVFARIDALG